MNQQLQAAVKIISWLGLELGSQLGLQFRVQLRVQVRLPLDVQVSVQVKMATIDMVTDPPLYCGNPHSAIWSPTQSDIGVIRDIGVTRAVAGTVMVTVAVTIAVTVKVAVVVTFKVAVTFQVVVTLKVVVAVKDRVLGVGGHVVIEHQIILPLCQAFTEHQARRTLFGCRKPASKGLA